MSNHSQRTVFKRQLNEPNRLSNNRIRPFCRDASVQVSEYDPQSFRNENGYSHLDFRGHCPMVDFNTRCKYCEKPLSLSDISYESADDNIQNLAEPYSRQCPANSMHRYSNENYAAFPENTCSRLCSSRNLQQIDFREPQSQKVPPMNQKYFRTRRSDLDSINDYSSSSSCNENLIRTLNPPWINPRYYEDDLSSVSRASSYISKKNSSFNYESYCNGYDQPIRIRNQYYKSQCSELPPLIHNNSRKLPKAKCLKYIEYSEIPDFGTPDEIGYYVDPVRDKMIDALSSSRISNFDLYRNVYRKTYSDDSLMSWTNAKRCGYKLSERVDYEDPSNMHFKRSCKKPSIPSINNEFNTRKPCTTPPRNDIGISYKGMHGKPQVYSTFREIDKGEDYKSININKNDSKNYNDALKQGNKVLPVTLSNNFSDCKKTNSNISPAAKKYYLPLKESAIPFIDKKFYSKKKNNSRQNVTSEKYDNLQKESLTAPPYKDSNRKRNSRYAPLKESLATEFHRNVNSKETFYDICNKQLQKESLPTTPMTKKKLKSPITTRNRVQNEYKKIESKLDTSDEDVIDYECRLKEASPPTANRYSSASSTSQSTPEREIYPNAETSERYQQKQIKNGTVDKIVKQSESKCTKCHEAHFCDEDSLASGDSTSPMILYSEIPTSASIHRNAKANLQDKDNASDEAYSNSTDSKKIPSNTDIHSSTPPSLPTDSKNQEVRVSELKPIEARSQEDRTSAELDESKSRSATKSKSNVSAQKAKSFTKLKSIYKNPDLKQQVYQNADDVLKEMKMVLMAKGMWNGK